jgi:signal transduction histidine kinase
MRGEIDVTLKRERTAAEYRETLSLVGSRLEELTRLTDDLMVLVRAQEGGRPSSIGEVPIAPLVRETAGRLRDVLAARGVTIAFAGFPDLVAYADARLFARVIDNLLHNALHYNRDGGAITIEGVEEPASPGEWTTGYVVVKVRDNGIGIPAAEQERVFERFYRLDRSRSRRTGGAGLGLSICREVMTLFGGTIRIADSSPDGSTVEIRLPGRRASEAMLSGQVAG